MSQSGPWLVESAWDGPGEVVMVRTDYTGMAMSREDAEHLMDALSRYLEEAP